MPKNDNGARVARVSRAILLSLVSVNLMNVGAPGLALFQTWEGTLPTIATEADEVQIVSTMPAFQSRRHTSSLELVVAWRCDPRHTSPVMTAASRVSNPRDPGHPYLR